MIRSSSVKRILPSPCSVLHSRLPTQPAANYFTVMQEKEKKASGFGQGKPAKRGFPTEKRFNLNSLPYLATAALSRACTLIAKASISTPKTVRQMPEHRFDVDAERVPLVHRPPLGLKGRKQ